MTIESFSKFSFGVDCRSHRSWDETRLWSWRKVVMPLSYFQGLSDGVADPFTFSKFYLYHYGFLVGNASEIRLLMLWSQNVLDMILKHLLMNICSMCLIVADSKQVSISYTTVDFTHLLNILSLACLNVYYSSLNATRTLSLHCWDDRWYTQSTDWACSLYRL